MYNICVKLHEASKQGLTILPLEIVDMLTVRGITMMGPALEYGPFNLGKAERYKDVRDPLVLTISWKTLSPAMRDSALLDPGTYTSTCFVDLYEAWLRSEAVRSTKGEGGAPVLVQPTAGSQTRPRWPFPFGRLW